MRGAGRAPDALTKIATLRLSQRYCALKRSAAVALNVGVRLIGFRGAFDTGAKWHKIFSPKERVSARTLTSRGMVWEPGPSLEWHGRRYRGDLFLRNRGVVLEVLSSGELERDTLERMAAFQAHGLRTELIGDERDLAAFLERG